MPDVVQVHQVTNMLQRVGRAAGDQSLHRNELGHFQIDAGGTLRGDRANHVALGEHADRGIAFGANHIVDHERADIAGAHQLGGDTHGLGHANRDYAGRSLLAQDLSDLNGNLLKGKLLGYVVYFWYTLYFFQSLADKFRKDAERVKQDARVVAESQACEDGCRGPRR